MVLQPKALLSIVLAATITLLSISQTNAAIGKVTEQTGKTEIIRKSKSMESNLNAPVEMLDTFVTAKAKVKLTFEDNTVVNINEQSKLVVDDFVYDGNKGTGKLALKVALGTARYASGQIAKSNPQSVNIQTPTATVAVRGTDFSMTVDELGRSLIMLLPSCDAKGCVTGAIEVSTEVGSVFLNQAYQATLVTSKTQFPTKPVIVTIDQANINNLLIVAPPKSVTEAEMKNDAKTALDINFLDQDLLRYSKLDENELTKYNALDLNQLDGDLLINLLDASTAALAASQEAMLAEKSLLPGYSEGSGLKYAIDDEGRLILTKLTSHTAQVTVNKEADVTVKIAQDGAPLIQQVNRGGSVINIIQK